MSYCHVSFGVSRSNNLHLPVLILHSCSAPCLVDIIWLHRDHNENQVSECHWPQVRNMPLTNCTLTIPVKPPPQMFQFIEMHHSFQITLLAWIWIILWKVISWPTNYDETVKVHLEPRNLHQILDISQEKCAILGMNLWHSGGPALWSWYPHLWMYEKSQN